MVSSSKNTCWLDIFSNQKPTNGKKKKKPQNVCFHLRHGD
jgi:hypothetical protein